MNNVTAQFYRFAKNSARNMISNIRSYVFFITFFSLQLLPADPLHFCSFMELMALTSGYIHLKNFLASVKYLSESYSHSFPSNNFSLDTTMQGLKRRLARTPFFVMRLTPHILSMVYRFLDMSKPEDLALWTSYPTAFYCLLRKANVVPESAQFNPSQILTRGHIVLDRANKIVPFHLHQDNTVLPEGSHHPSTIQCQSSLVQAHGTSTGQCGCAC